MITGEYCVHMARLARWQNRQLVAALSELEAAQLRRARLKGAAGLAGLCALALEQDAIWLQRLGVVSREVAAQARISGLVEDWDDWRRSRLELDAALCLWAERVGPEELSGTLHWAPGGDQRPMSRPMWLCVTNLFTLQADLRGQIVTELAQMGQRVDLGDALALPDDVDWM